MTVEALTKHALQPDQRARLEMEARTGEYKVACAKAQSESALAQSWEPLLRQFPRQRQRQAGTPLGLSKPLSATPWRIPANG